MARDASKHKVVIELRKGLERLQVLVVSELLSKVGHQLFEVLYFSLVLHNHSRSDHHGIR